MSCITHSIEHNKCAAVRIRKIYEERPGKIDVAGRLTPTKILCARHSQAIVLPS